MGTGTLEQLRKYLEKAAGCDSRTWRNLLGCNLPKRRGMVPLLERALATDIIPQEFAKGYFAEIKREEEKLLASGFPPLYIIFSGDVGNYKTLMAVRLLAIKTVTERLTPLFLTSDELLALYRGELHLCMFVDDVTFSVETELRPPSYDNAQERVPFTEITKQYDLILIDDLEEEAVEAFEKLVNQAYNTETLLIVTTNIAPPKRLLELVSQKSRSRLAERGIPIYVQGTDKRGGAR